MKGATNKPVGVASKPGSRSMERPRATSLTSSGTKSSKYSSSLPTHSQLSKVKSKSSDDLSSKAGGSLTSSSSRLKKTVTMGTIAELTENKAKSSPGASASTRRSGIPAPRESATLTKEKVSRERSRTQPSKKPTPAPVGGDISTPARLVRTAVKPRAESEGSDRARMEIQVKELLMEAKAKDFEVSKLRCELKHLQDRQAVSLDTTPDTGEDTGEKTQPQVLLGSPGDGDSQLKKLQETNWLFQQELGQLRVEKQVLQERVCTLEQLWEQESGTKGNSLSLEVTLSSGPSSSLGTPSSLESMRNPTGEALDSVPMVVNGEPSHSSVSNMNDVTKGSPSPSPDWLGSDGVFHPSSISSDGFRASTTSSDTSSEGSLKNTSLVSVASLAEKIQQMEENQHCTAEELQATLQELSDQQQVIQELTVENERLMEEKGVLQDSVHQQQERLQQLLREKQQLGSLLQDGQVSRVSELGQGVDLCQEELLKVQQSVSNGWTLEKEPLGAEALRDEAGNLQKLLEAEQEQNASIAQTLADCQTTAGALQTENSSLRNQLELERQKLSEQKPAQSVAETCQFQELLGAAQTERQQLEVECMELRERSLQATSEVSRLHSLLLKVEREQALTLGWNQRRLEESSFTAQRLQDETRDKDSEIKDMKETIFELQDQVEQHQAVKLHNNRTIEDLEHKVMMLEQQKLELEKQLKMFNKKMKEEAEEWHYFQADLQTAVVVANDIKCDAQQESRVLRRKLQEAETRAERLQKELEVLQGHRSDLSPGCEAKTLSR